MEIRQYCTLIGGYLENRFDCIDLSKIFHHNKTCHRTFCRSQWRICPACIVQGDAEKHELRKEIFSKGHVDGDDCEFCEFHYTYGHMARRTDKEYREKTKKIRFMPEESIELVIEGVCYRKIAPPLLSQFFYHSLDKRISLLYKEAIARRPSVEDIRKRLKAFNKLGALKLDKFEDDLLDPETELKIKTEKPEIKESTKVERRKYERKGADIRKKRFRKNR